VIKQVCIHFIFVFFLLSTGLFGQGKPYDGPDDPAGDIAAERSGWMTGNRVLLFFRNTTELSDCCGLGYDVSKWPNNYEGTKMHDGIAVLIGARVYLENDTIPVTDVDEIHSRIDLDTLYYIQSSFRVFMDTDPTLTLEYGLYPVFGYFNELGETPAMSNNPESWPLSGWPAQENTLKWPGEWNGRFGRGVMKADLECFFVANDAQDQEYLGDRNRVKYYPRPGVKIGDKNSNVSIQFGKPWGGIGVRIETRGFQWANPSAADAIFWEYNISNISDYDLTEMFFGFQVDNAVGGEEGLGDDIAFYDKSLNMCYSWDIDFVPVGGGKEPGLLGLAYLESPGIAYDAIDNDLDGLIDEKRNNVAQNKIGPYDGIADLNNFLSFYKLKEEDLKEHWDADEDQDWNDGLDLNGNGTYSVYKDGAWQVEQGEIPGDDLGLDGVGPFDINYNGPDEGECNHRPDFIEGVGCEPNFAATDISESDMLGLTSFRYLLSWIETGGINTMQIDESLWYYVSPGLFDEIQPIALNFIEYFASGIFPLYKGRTERLSLSELHSYDALTGLMAEDHAAPALFRLKEVVQVIYETDYRFAQPPLMPTLTAVPGDGKVILTWDDIADTKTRDPFVNNANDFEGYKLYRATDKKMSDAEVVTDGYGNPILKKPIFQCDIVDRIGGFANYGAVNGAEYYLGNDTGIQHYFVDNTVQNGRTYYYVLVAYDYGLPDVGSGISPSENTYVLELDETEEVSDISKNAAIVTPHQYASGYVPPSIDDMASENSTLGSGSIQTDVVLFDQIKPNHTYKVKFDVGIVNHLRGTVQIRHPMDILYTNTGFSVYDITAGDSLVYQETKERFSGRNIIPNEITLSNGEDVKYWYFNTSGMTSGVFDGIQLKISMPLIFAEHDPENSGWLMGNSPVNVLVNKNESVFYPWQYNIVFTDNDTAYTSRTTVKNFIRSAQDEPIVSKSVLLGQTFSFYVINKTFPSEDNTYEKLDLMVHDVNRNGMFEPDSDWVLAGFAKTAGTRTYWGGTIFGFNFHDAWPDNMPEAGNVYQVDFKRPFVDTDSLLFMAEPENELDEDKLLDGMENITVVPNPYVMTNVMESAVANYQLNQRRQIMFTNLPAQCTIKIFSTSGVFVDEIEVKNSSESRQTDWDLNSSANGTAKWDLKTNTGLDVAPGYYIYHIQSTRTGHEKMGKFAILK